MDNEIEKLLCYLKNFNHCQVSPIEYLEITLEDKQSTRFYSDEWDKIKTYYKKLIEFRTKIEDIIQEAELLKSEIEIAQTNKKNNRIDWYHKKDF